MSYHMGKKEELSKKSKAFHEGQEVSFIFRKEMRIGRIEVLKINSAVITIKSLKNQKGNAEKTVINYDKLMSVYE